METCQSRDSYILSANACKIRNTSCTAPHTRLTPISVSLQSQFGTTFLQTSCKTAWCSQESWGNNCCMRCFRSPQPVEVQSRKAATQQHGCFLHAQLSTNTQLVLEGAQHWKQIFPKASPALSCHWAEVGSQSITQAFA